MSSSIVMAFVFVLVLSDYERDHRWTGFLGPATPTVTASRLPLTWSATENIAWQSPINGYGQSSPVIWGEHVYVSSVSGKKKESLHVTAFHIATGAVRWEFSTLTNNQGENSDYFSRAAPTPVVSEHGLVIFFENGDMVALSHAGKELWRKDFAVEFGPITSRHGIASSLAIDQDRIFVWIPRDEQPYVACLDQKTGAVQWKQELPPGTSWSSPTLAEMPDGSRHLVLSIGGAGGGGGGGGPPRGRQVDRAEGDTASSTEAPKPSPPPPPVPGRLLGLDPLSGKTLWELGSLTGNSTPTPTCVTPGKFLIGASAGREGGPSKEAIATNGLVSVEKTDSSWQAQYVWRSERATCGFSSPIHHRGLCYFVDRRGRLFCLEATSGKEVFYENLAHPVWATPLAIGDRIYFVGEEGVTTVIRSGDRFEKLASNSLWESASEPVNEKDPRSMLGRTRQYAIAAIADAIFIRRGDRLYCLKVGSDDVSQTNQENPK
ncbi:MAG: PQQ-binding-like beta-propeller repeat protein [Planctomycetota bacterium]